MDSAKALKLLKSNKNLEKDKRASYYTLSGISTPLSGQKSRSNSTMQKGKEQSKKKKVTEDLKRKNS